jgi:hypothetical protein
MNQVTLAQLAAPAAQQVEVYLARYGGCVTLEELGSPAVIMAAQLAREIVPGTDGMTALNPLRYKALRIAFALRLPDAPANESLEQIAGRLCATVEALPWSDQLLLADVLELLSVGRLTESQRDMLKAEGSTADKLDALGGLVAPLNVLEEAGADADLILSVVAAGFPQALGEWTVPFTRLVYGALMAAEDRQARKVAEALRG